MGGQSPLSHNHTKRVEILAKQSHTLLHSQIHINSIITQSNILKGIANDPAFQSYIPSTLNISGKIVTDTYVGVGWLNVTFPLLHI